MIHLVRSPGSGNCKLWRVALALIIVGGLTPRALADEPTQVAEDGSIRVELLVFPSEHGFRVGERACAVLRVISSEARALWHTAIDADRAVPAFVGVESATYTEGSGCGLIRRLSPRWRGFELRPYRELEYCETFELREPGRLTVSANLQADLPPHDLGAKFSSARLWKGKLCVKKEITVDPERSPATLARIKTVLDRFRQRAATRPVPVEQVQLPESGATADLIQLGFAALPELLSLHAESALQDGERAAVMLAIAGLTGRAYSEAALSRALVVAQSETASHKERWAALLAFRALRRTSKVKTPPAILASVEQCLGKLASEDNPELRPEAEGLLKAIRR